MAEMGIPTSAASASAPMYRLERITATGSIGGGPLAAAAPSCRLTSGTAPVLGLFESAIRCSLPSDQSDEAVCRSSRDQAHTDGEGGARPKGPDPHAMPHLTVNDATTVDRMVFGRRENGRPETHQACETAVVCSGPSPAPSSGSRLLCSSGSLLCGRAGS